MIHQLPDLPYAYDALEPIIDAQTMHLHHDKHHQTYVEKLNLVLEKNPGIAETPLIDLMKKLNTLKISDSDITALKNHGGGHLNHTLFWQLMNPKNSLDQNLVSDVEREFGGLDKFKEIFSNAALNHFGSGWAFAVRDEKQKLKIYSLPNQDSPFLQNHTPVLALDVWEHAYYLKYQNRRAEYIKAWWKLIKII